MGDKPKEWRLYDFPSFAMVEFSENFEHWCNDNSPNTWFVHRVISREIRVCNVAVIGWFPPDWTDVVHVLLHFATVIVFQLPSLEHCPRHFSPPLHLSYSADVIKFVCVHLPCTCVDNETGNCLPTSFPLHDLNISMQMIWAAVAMQSNNKKLSQFTMFCVAFVQKSSTATFNSL